MKAMYISIRFEYYYWSFNITRTNLIGLGPVRLLDVTGFKAYSLKSKNWSDRLNDVVYLFIFIYFEGQNQPWRRVLLAASPAKSDRGRCGHWLRAAVAETEFRC